MTMHMKNPTAGGAAGLDKTSLPGRNDGPSSAPKTDPAQAEILRNPRAELVAQAERLERRA